MRQTQEITVNENSILNLKSSRFDTPIGPMLAIADDKALYLLEFINGRGVEREIDRLKQRLSLDIISGVTPITRSIEQELKAYFKGQLKTFTTPIQLLGTAFQKRVWKALQKIPFAKTRSYADMAKAIHHPSAFRAVANANGANQISIVIPCHRVIQSNGTLGGYGGGVMRKEWLLKHEKNF